MEKFKQKCFQKLLEHISVKIMNKIAKADIKLNLIIFKNENKNMKNKNIINQW